MRSLLSLLALLIIVQTASAQEDTIPVYKRFPNLPLFTIMTVPDSVKFTRDDLQHKKKTIIMLFSPDCSHCQVAVKDLLDNKLLFQKTQILMVSSMDFSAIKKFYADYKIAEESNIVMGRDASYYLGTFYKLTQFPSLYIYDKKGKFVKAFEGTFKMEDVAKEL